VTESERDPWLGRTLDSQYRVDELLGEGGMGRVYLAHHLDMDRQVVLKVIRTGLHDEKLRTRFRREGQLIARLRHPNIVQVYSAGETANGELYLVMEYIPGRTLEAIIRDDGPFDEPRFLRLARQIAAAVASAHAEGIVHRDLKPANVLVTRVAGAMEHVKVLDFGIAKIVGGDELADAKLTKTGWLMGTPAYMSPEQIESRPVDARTDVYALGVIFDEMVTGANAYAAPTPIECFRRHLSMELEPVAERAPHVELSPRLEGIVARCLAKDPNLRFGDASALLEALDDVTYDPARVTLRPTNTPTPTPRPAPPIGRRDPARVILGVVLAACAIVAALLIATLLSREGDSTDGTAHPSSGPASESDVKRPPPRPPGSPLPTPVVIGATPGSGTKPPPVWTSGSPATGPDARLALPSAPPSLSPCRRPHCRPR
jgi:serine/threonine protein kinase